MHYADSRVRMHAQHEIQADTHTHICLLPPPPTSTATVCPQAVKFPDGKLAVSCELSHQSSL